MKFFQWNYQLFYSYVTYLNNLCFKFCHNWQEYVPVEDDVVAQLRWEKEQVEYNSSLQVEIAH